MALRDIFRAIVATWWVYSSVGVLIPLLPQYVEARYGGGATAIGVAVLVYASANVAGRPIASLLIRFCEPWRLMAFSLVVGAGALLLTPLAPNLWWMLTARAIDGAAVGMFYTAAATSVVRQTPHSQRGRILSYFSVPLFVGVAIGPVVGDMSIDWNGHDATWLLSGMLMLLGLPVCLNWREAKPYQGATSRAITGHSTKDSDRRIAPGRHGLAAAAWPSLVLALSIAGFGGFQALVPVYGPQIGLATTGTVFFAHSLLSMSIRIVCAPIIDRLPIVESILIGCAADIVGLSVVWLWPTPVALYIGALLMAVAIALQYVLLMKLALADASDRDEGVVVATYSSAYDIGAGLGAVSLGFVAALTDSYRSAFFAGALFALLGAVVLVARFWPQRRLYAV